MKQVFRIAVLALAFGLLMLGYHSSALAQSPGDIVALGKAIFLTGTCR